jgi:hypothetical protein
MILAACSRHAAGWIERKRNPSWARHNGKIAQLDNRTTGLIAESKTRMNALSTRNSSRDRSAGQTGR